MRRLRVLLGVAPPALCRVLDYLLWDHSEFRVIAHCVAKNALRRQTARLLPDVLLVNDKVLGNEPREVIAHIKRSSPRTKMIVIASPETTGRWHSLGADACVSEEALVRRLVATLRQFSLESTCGRAIPNHPPFFFAVSKTTKRAAEARA